MTDLKTQVLEFLATQGDHVGTLQIAKAMGLKTAKEINPTLYSLMKDNKIKKESEPNGSKPRWSVIYFASS